MLCLNVYLRRSTHSTLTAKRKVLKSFFLFPEGSKIQCQYYSIFLEMLSGLSSVYGQMGRQIQAPFLKCEYISVFQNAVLKPRFDYDSTERSQAKKQSIQSFISS